MARQGAPGLLGIHINLPATVPPEVAAALAGGAPPEGLSDQERAVVEAHGVRERRQRGVLRDADREAADGRLRYDRLAGRPRGLDPGAPGLCPMDIGGRSRQVADERRVLDDIRCTG